MFSKIKNKLSKEVIIVLIILGLGTFIRFIGLTSLPPGLYPDEAMNTTDGLTTAEAGQWKLFYENNNGREGLYINILGYLLHWFGLSLWIIRFLPALIGSLTLAAVYWIARRLMGKFGAIAALALMAFSYWHLNFSRVGFRAILMVGLTAWAFAFIIEGFWRMIYRKNMPYYWLFFALGGLLLGLSLHTYIAVRIIPAVIVALWASALIFFGNQWKDIIKSLLIVAIFAAITAAPLLYDFAISPEHFSGRTNNVSVLKSPNLLSDLGKSTGLTMLSFIAYGDQNWRHNYPYLPLTLPFWGIILFIGVILGIIKFFRGVLGKILGKGASNLKNNWQIVTWVFLIAWWVFLLVPSILTNEGLPHALRSIGAIPATFLLIGFMVDRWSKKPKIKKLFIVLVAATSIINVGAYFFLFGRNAEAFGAFEYRLSSLGIYLRETIPQDSQNNYYLVTNQDSFRTSANLPVMVEPIRFYTWQFRHKLKFIVPEDFEVSAIKTPAKIFFTRKEEDVVSQIKSRYPDTETVTVNAKNDPILQNNANPEDFLRSPFAPETNFSYLLIR